MDEAVLGYPQHYWYALSHLAEAEAELVAEHPHLAGLVRGARKELEIYPRHVVPFTELLLKVANFGGYDITELLVEDKPLSAQEDG